MVQPQVSKDTAPDKQGGTDQRADATKRDAKANKDVSVRPVTVLPWGRMR